MRVLLTGMTSATGNGRRPFDYIVHFDWVRWMLEAAGHEVDWRAVTPGEPLRDRYDVAVVGALKLVSLSTLARRYGALWACSQLPHLLVFDDWAIMQVWQSWKPRYLWRDMGKFEEGAVGIAKTAAQGVREQLDQVVERFAAGNVHGLVMAWDWGDHALLRKYLRCRLHTLEPTPFYAEHQYDVGLVETKHKRREWLSSSIANAQAWIGTQKLSWPVHTIGPAAPRGIGGKPTKASRWDKQDEATVVRDQMAPRWGNLMMPYPHVGSGWWRLRFYLASSVRSVTLCDPAELRGFGPEVDAAFVGADVLQRLTTVQLEEHAELQREVLYREAPSRKAVLAKLGGVLDQVRRDGAACAS